MKKPEFEIPNERLPHGFARKVDHAPESPAVPRPASTIVLVRPGGGGPEVLLLRRNRSVGFVPGAYVFPGGRVEPEDALPESLDRLSGLSAADAALRLGLPVGDPTAAAYYVAAFREAFEETGILVARDRSGRSPFIDPRDALLASARERLHRGSEGFARLLAELNLTLDGAAVEYIAHWITPVAEPRRYDTRFFAVALDSGIDAHPDGREVTEGVWLTPEVAIRRNKAGSLPMVFPTIKTLHSFLPFNDVADLLQAFRDRDIPTILPRLVRTPKGVGIEMPDSSDSA